MAHSPQPDIDVGGEDFENNNNNSGLKTSLNNDGCYGDEDEYDDDEELVIDEDDNATTPLKTLNVITPPRTISSMEDEPPTTIPTPQYLTSAISSTIETGKNQPNIQSPTATSALATMQALFAPIRTTREGTVPVTPYGINRLIESTLPAPPVVIEPMDDEVSDRHVPRSDIFEQDFANNSSGRVTSPPQGAPPKRCAPVREAVDPGKYNIVQEGTIVKYACSKCGNIYKWKKSLNKHWKEKHTGEVPDPKPANEMPQILPEMFRPISSTNGDRRVQKGSNKRSAPSSRRSTPSPSAIQQAALRSIMQTSPGEPDLFSLSDPTFRTPQNQHRLGNGLITPSLFAGHHKYMSTSTPKLKSPASQHVLTPSAMMEFTQHKSSSLRQATSHTVTNSSQLSPPAAHSSNPKPSTTTVPALFTPPHRPVGVTPRGISLIAPAANIAPSSSVDGENILDLSVNKNDSPLTDSLSFEQDEPLDLSVGKPTGDNNGSQVSANNISLWGSNNADRFDCAQCSQVYVSLDELNQHFAVEHMAAISDYKNQARQEDNQQSSSGKQLYQYLTMDMSANAMSCLVCGAVYQWQWALATHFEQEHASLPNPYQQRIGTPTPSAAPVSADNGEEPGNKKRRLQCNQCTFTTGSVSDLTRHQLIHTINKHQVCKLCGYTARTKQELNEHYTEDHPNIVLSEHQSPTPPPPLPTANQSTEINLLGPDGKPLANTAIVIPQAPEETSNHTHRPSKAGRKPNLNGPSGAASGFVGFLPHRCPHCEYRARWPSEITQHMKNHSDEKPFGCCHCEYTSKWKWDVVKHMKRCGGGGVNDVVNLKELKEFAQKLAPQANTLAHTQGRGLSNGPPNVTVTRDGMGMKTGSSPPTGRETPSPVSTGEEQQQNTIRDPLQCSKCLFIASSPTELKRHIKSHKYNTSQVYCSLCSFVGNSQTDLTRHMRVHSDEKPYPCLSCSYSSKWKCDLKKHCENYNHIPAVDLTYGGHGRKPKAAAKKSAVQPAPNGRRNSSEGESSSDSCSEYRCDKCQFVATSQAVYNAHMKNHSPAGFKCKRCDFQCGDLTVYLKHKQSHTAGVSSGAEATPTVESTTDHVQLNGDTETRECNMNNTKSRRKQSKQAIVKTPRVSSAEDVNDKELDNKDTFDNNSATNGQEESFQRHVEGYSEEFDDEENCLTEAADLKPEHFYQPESEKNESSYHQDVRNGQISPPFRPDEKSTKEGKKTKRRQKNCTKCDYVTDNVTTLQRHMEKHGKRGKFTCTHCDYSVDKEKFLHYHYSTGHITPGTPQRDTASPYCDTDNASTSTVDFNDNTSVESGSHASGDVTSRGGTTNNININTVDGENINIVHVGKRTVYSCTKCEYHTMKIQGAINHIKQHGQKKRFTCSYCDYSVDQLTHVKYHMRRVHGHDGAAMNGEMDVSIRNNLRLAGDDDYYLREDDVESLVSSTTDVVSMENDTEDNCDGEYKQTRHINGITST